MFSAISQQAVVCTVLLNTSIAHLASEALARLPLDSGRLLCVWESACPIGLQHMQQRPASGSKTLSMSEGQRRSLAELLNGKPCKRPAARKPELPPARAAAAASGPRALPVLRLGVQFLHVC